MVDFAELWETINDKCWPIAEAVKLDEFFDEKNIPPVILPLAALLIILVLAFVLMSGGPATTEDVCGDGICGANETFFLAQIVHNQKHQKVGMLLSD